MKKHTIQITVIILIILEIIVWKQIIFPQNDLSLYFLNVGQGDSSLLNLGNVQIVIDTGRDFKVLDELKKVLQSTDRYIDLIVITHPDFDHYGGTLDILKRYEVGAVITNGLNRDVKAWKSLMEYIEDENIPIIALSEGDKIKYKESELKVLHPNKFYLSKKETNDTSLVLKFESPRFTTLFTGDIGAVLEKYLINKYSKILASDILKISHHGSKYSSDMGFLKTVNPHLSLIGVGKNSYGHPTKEVLGRLTALNIDIFRTDEAGTIKILNGRVYSSLTSFSLHR